MSLIVEGDPNFVETNTKIEDLPRCTQINPYNYTPSQLAQNKIWLAELQRLHPDVPDYFLNLSIHAYNAWGPTETEARIAEWDNATS